MKVMMKASCRPFLMHHPSSNRSTFSISRSSLKLPQSSLSFSVSRRHHTTGSSLLLTNNQKARPLTFQCHCTDVENLGETSFGYDSRSGEHYVPILETLWMFFWRSIKNVAFAISEVAVKCVRVFKALSFIVKMIRRSKKKEPRDVSFDDLVGVDALRNRFRRMIPILHEKSDSQNSYGVVIYGSQGTGKTTLVHALAREARVSFFPVCAAEIAEGSVSLFSLFLEAKAYSPSIVLIEDVDAIAEKGKPNPALHELKWEMDICYGNISTVMVIVTTTNKPDTLDPFLLSSYRFYNKLHVGLPDEDSKRKFVSLQLNTAVREEDKEAICNLVSQTPGLVWGDIEYLASSSKLSAHSRGDDHVTMEDVLEVLGSLNDILDMRKNATC